MREHQHLAGGEIGRDLAGEQTPGDMVRHQHHDDVGPLRDRGHRVDREAGGLRLRARAAVVGQSDPDVDTAVLEIEGVRVPLRPVADDRHFFRADQRQIRIVVIEHLCRFGHF
jgi:hypothetical protein